MADPKPQNDDAPINCANLPSTVSSFIDTFVDFSVSGGIFLPPDPNVNSHQTPFFETVFPQPARLIAIGDLHGDLKKAKQALRLANLIDSNDRWCGGSTTVVQVGDILDRGGDEIKLLYFFEKLRREAVREGGLVITMNGNHEIMNVDGDFRYVTKAGYKEFADWGVWQVAGCRMRRLCVGVEIEPDYEKQVLEGCDSVETRRIALRPNGLVSSRFLLKNHTVVVVGDSVFAHGGLLERHVVHGLDRVNEEVRDWIKGVSEKVGNHLVRGRNSIVWLRKFSHELAKDCDCSLLEHVLETIPGVKRMIMGHTIQQEGINTACGNRAIRVDVGMSRGCGDRFPEVLEINEKSEIRILTSNPLYSKRFEGYENENGKDGLGLLVPERRSRQVEVGA